MSVAGEGSSISKDEEAWKSIMGSQIAESLKMVGRACLMVGAGQALAGFPIH